MTEERDESKENWFWDVYMKMSSEEKQKWNEDNISRSRENLEEVEGDLTELSKLETALFSEQKIDFEVVNIIDGADPAKVKTLLDGDIEWKMSYLSRLQESETDAMDKMMLLIQDICLCICIIPGEKNDPWDSPKAWQMMHRKLGTFGLQEVLYDSLLGPYFDKIEQSQKFRQDAQRNGFRPGSSKPRKKPRELQENSPSA